MLSIAWETLFDAKLTSLSRLAGENSDTMGYKTNGTSRGVRSLELVNMTLFSSKTAPAEPVLPIPIDLPNSPVMEKIEKPGADINQAREGVNQAPPMTIKRLMALFSLACLLDATQIPLYLIGGLLGYSSARLFANPVSIYCSRYRGRKFIWYPPSSIID